MPATGDEAYGSSPHLRRGRYRAGLSFALARATSTKLRIDPLIEAQRADHLTEQIPARNWQAQSVGKGTKDPSEYSCGWPDLTIDEATTGHHYLLAR